MFNWKIVATIFITLGILVVFLSSSPQLGNFFGSIKEKISNLLPEQSVDRNVSFTLDTGLVDIGSEVKDVNIEFRTDNFSARVKDIDVNSHGLVRILGFSGSLSVTKQLSLDGSFRKVELEGTTFMLPQGSIKTEPTFETLAIDNLALKELIVTKGKITVNNVETDSDSEIRILSPLGRFTFDDRLRVVGKANKISVPAAKIFIG